jgi:hypothetical protein
MSYDDCIAIAISIAMAMCDSWALILKWILRHQGLV